MPRSDLEPMWQRTLALLEQTSRAESLRRHFEQKPIFRNAEYREMFGVTRHVALAELRRLVERYAPA